MMEKNTIDLLSNYIFVNLEIIDFVCCHVSYLRTV